jgi:hypothetical protein
MADQDFTSGTEENMLDWFFTTVGAPSRPTVWWISLFTVIPSANDGTGGTECSNAGYGRIEVTTFDRTDQTLKPDAVVTFGPASEDWDEVVAWGIHSLETSGVIYAFKSLTTPRTVTDGDSAEFAVNDLTIDLD